MSLTKEQHLLQKLSEECVEVSKEVSKAILFGLDNIKNSEITSNKEKIQNELADLLGVVELLIEKGSLNRCEIFHTNKINMKKLKVNKWMQDSIKRGITK